MLVLLIILYFSIVGSLFYKLFIIAPTERELVKESVTEPVQQLEKEFVQGPVTSHFTSNEAADINVG